MKSGMIKAVVNGFQAIRCNQVDLCKMNMRISRLMKKKLDEWKEKRMEKMYFDSFFSFKSKVDKYSLQVLDQLSAALKN